MAALFRENKIGSIKLNQVLLVRLLVFGGSRDMIGRKRNNKSEVLNGEKKEGSGLSLPKDAL